MEKVEEKNLKKKSGKFDETLILNDLNEIISQKEIKNSQKEIKNSQKENTDSVKLADNKQVTKSGKDIVKEAERIINNVDKKGQNNLEKKEQNNVEKIENQTQKNKEKKNRKALKLLLILMFIILFAVIFSTIFSILNINNNKMMDGVIINNINISNLTKQEAINLLNNTLNNNEQNYVTVTRNGITEYIYLEDINGKFDTEAIVNEAYKIGREGNIVECNYEILFTKLFKKSMVANMQYDNELLEQKIDEISLKMPDVALNSSYTIVENNLIIKNSTDGYVIKKDEFEKELFEAFSTSSKTFDIPVEKAVKEEIDIEKIHSEIYKEAKNAYYTTNPYKIYAEENGLDFAITIEEAEQILLEDKEEYSIPLKTLEPSIKIKDLDSKAFPDQLATFTTYYGTADSGRCYNIYLAAKSITEAVVMPGETFSYNDLIGECSTRTGYRESTIYLNGKVSKGIGGGICQVSTTLYNAVLGANLEIVERRNHSLSVTYVPLGQDAMVSIGSSDFKFKNNRDYPIKVIATTGTGSVTCQIYGLKNQTEYEVKLETHILSKTTTKTKTETYKILYLNGEEVSRTLISTDSYKNH